MNTLGRYHHPGLSQKTNLDGASIDVEDISYLNSTGHDRTGTSKNEQVVCKVNEGLNLPSAMNHSSGTETQPKPNDVDSKIRNEAHLADFKKEAANLHRMIRSARFLYERRLELPSTESPKPFLPTLGENVMTI